LLIGLVFLAVTAVAGDLIASALKGQHLAEILRETLLIGGWVVMWRRLEILLYEWWPIRSEARLYDRLSATPVRITYTGDGDRTPGAETGRPHRRCGHPNNSRRRNAKRRLRTGRPKARH
jgi:hypothetical protein